MYDMAKLKNLKTLGAGAPKAMDAFWAFDKAAMADGAVPKKYKELIALGVALTTQCPYCLEVHRSAAEAAGATQEEVAKLRWSRPPCAPAQRSLTPHTCSPPPPNRLESFRESPGLKARPGSTHDQTCPNHVFDSFRNAQDQRPEVSCVTG